MGRTPAIVVSLLILLSTIPRFRAGEASTPVRESTGRSQWLQPFYGCLWWVNTNGIMWRDVPGDAYAALGAEEKKIYIVPSLDIIAVRLGGPQPAWSDNTFLGRVCQSIIVR